MFIKFDAIAEFLTEAVGHYEKSAPTVSEYLDDLYIRLNEDIASVSLIEISRLATLKENGIWQDPNVAANNVYKLMHSLGQDTTGHAGF